jgi:hypothetical protein
VQLDQVFDDRQPESQASMLACHLLIGTPRRASRRRACPA